MPSKQPLSSSPKVISDAPPTGGKDCNNKTYPTADTVTSSKPSPSESQSMPQQLPSSSSPAVKSNASPFGCHVTPTKLSPTTSAPTPIASSTPIKITSLKPVAAPLKQAIAKQPCNCQTRCNSKKRCSCKAAGFICSKACHPGRSCSNDNATQSAASKQLTITDITKSVKNEQQKVNQYKPWTTCCEVNLCTKQKAILLSPRAWLDDELINAAQSMLKQQHPLMGGLQSPVLGDHLAMTPPDSEFVQVIIVNGDHWIAVSTVGCQPSTIKVFDSLGGRLPKRSLKLVADLMQSQEKQLSIEFIDVQKQRGGSDCGLFSLVFITSICNGQDPAKQVYDQTAMRNHLQQCIERGQMAPFPSSASRKPEQTVTKTIKIYCVV